MTIEAGKNTAAAARRIRLGMVGGGEGAFIGGVHRIAARLDDQYELVAGALAPRADQARRPRVAPRPAAGPASPPGSTTSTGSAPARSPRAPTRRGAPGSPSASPRTASTPTSRRW